MIISPNLNEYIDLQVKNRCKNAYNAKHYFRENVDYVISKVEASSEFKQFLKEMGLNFRDKYKISPVDYRIMGVVYLKMVWSDGLAQFLQIKHGLPIEPEDLTTTFLSHYNFLRLYINNGENNIYGVTVTLGLDSPKLLLFELLEVETCIIPSFRPSKMVYLKSRSEYENKEG